MVDRRAVILGTATLAAVGTAGGAVAGSASAAGAPDGSASGTRSGASGGDSDASAGRAHGAAAEAPANMPAERVLGIGGFFFRSRDPKKLAQWYQLHLGIDPLPTDYGHHGWQQAAGETAFAPFPMDTDYFGSKQQGWMVNYRVRSLDAMVAQLQKANIEVKVDPQKYPNGRFARLHDPEGNPIELWEPASPQ